jgi:hypothetical protein
MKTTGSNGGGSNGSNNNADRVRRLFPETANENQRGHIPARDIAATLADHIHASERFGYRLHHPLPYSDLQPPYQATDSTMRGYLQAIAADPMA